MAISVGGGAETPMSDINTTPLVDVMLVLLIIFLITIPVVAQTVPVQLPKETNVARQTTPETVEIAVSREGDIYWNTQLVPDADLLFQRLAQVAKMSPQPAVHIRGDEKARYESVGRILLACQRAAIARVSFVTEPPPRGAGS